jgi:Ca2+-transporting ATPase
LWLNLVSDVMPGLALGLEPPEPDVLDQPPHDPRAPILTRQDFRRLLREGAVLGAGGIALFLSMGGARGPSGNSRANTIAFHGLILAQLVHAFACRSETHGLLEELRRPPNFKLFGAVAGGLALQVGAQTIPSLRRLLQLTPLGPGDLGTILGAALGPLTLNEILTAMFRREGGLPDI